MLELILPKIIMAGDAAHPVWHEDARFYVLVCIIAFFALLIWKGAHKAIAKALDDRADKISAELDEARRLREEAQALLASYQRKQKEAEELADGIVKQARRDAEIMAANSRKELKERLERRAVAAESKIASAEAKALSEVRAKAADVALGAAETLLRDNIKAADQTRLVKDGIAQMGKVLN